MNFWHLFTLVLLIAKLAGYFAGSWWLVFLPSVVGVVLGLTFMIFGVIIAALK